MPVIAHHPLLEHFLVRRAHDDTVHFIDQSFLIQWDLDTVNLNEPHYE